MEIKNTYSLKYKIYLTVCWLRTKLICRNARIIRFPIDIRGKRFIDFGLHLTTGIGCRLEAFSEDGKKTMYFGNDIQINDYVHICAMKKVVIGNNVLMAGRIYISDNSHGFYRGNNSTSPDIPPVQRKYYIAPVCIEDNVWIGEGVVIMPGVTIGRGSVIGANAVVTKNFPSFVIAVGEPAKPVKQYNFETKKWEKI
jgi:acetyltransferase-like isoleucine patch superfamily enzyme